MRTLSLLLCLTLLGAAVPLLLRAVCRDFSLRSFANRESASCVAKRETGVLYEVDHRNETLFIVTNADGALDFKLCAVPLEAVLAAPADAPAGRAAWAPVSGFPYDPLRKARRIANTVPELAPSSRLQRAGLSELLPRVLRAAPPQVDSVDCFKDHLAVFGREGGLSAFWVLTPAGAYADAWAARKWVAPEDAYEVSCGALLSPLSASHSPDLTSAPRERICKTFGTPVRHERGIRQPQRAHRVLLHGDANHVDRPQRRR